MDAGFASPKLSRDGGFAAVQTTLMIAMAPPSAILMAVAAALCVGIMTPITLGPFYAVIQSGVEPDMQARILTLLSSLGGGMAPLGLLIAGPVADHTGIKNWFFLGGILCVLMSVAGLLIPAVMDIENHQSRMLVKEEVEA